MAEITQTERVEFYVWIITFEETGAVRVSTMVKHAIDAISAAESTFSHISKDEDIIGVELKGHRAAITRSLV